jgi:aminoglycoside phosphotransferase (APT) family kinase protein
MSQEIEAALPALFGPITGLKRLSGGASQETWAFDASGRALILRRAPGGTPIAASAEAIGLETEAAVIAAANAAGAPTPTVVYVCTPRDGLGAAYVMARLAGETIARKILRDAPFAGARVKLASQCGAALAAIHAVDAAQLSLPSADAHAQLNRYEEIYRSFNAPRPMMALAFAHLRRTAPAPIPLGLVHGDFRLGNLMVDETGLSAALDWELSHIGDPAEDLGWICTPSWRFGQIDQPVGGFGGFEDLLSAYHAHGGASAVDAHRVRWWTMMGALKWGVMCLIMYRAFEAGLDRSVERAAVGRRASETELDLALMLAGKL